MVLKPIACSQQNFKISDIWELKEKISFNTEYQRSSVWRLDKQQYLIDSIIRGYDISKIFLRQLLDGQYECLDGQQRLHAIFAYLEDKFSLSNKFTPEVGNKKFSQLEEELKWRIRAFIIYATLVHNIDDETTCQIFLRLQEGMPLNAPEKLNAMKGEVRNEIVELSQHNFFQKLGIKDHRFSHRYICAQIILLETRGNIVDTKFKNLKEMYKTSLSFVKFDQVVSILNFLEKEFDYDAKLIKKNADFVSLFMFGSYLVKNYSLTDSRGKIKDFFKEFLIKVGKIKSAESESDLAFWNYKTYRKTSTDSKNSMEQRFNILLSEFLKYTPNIEPKDKKRDFDYWQRLAIFGRAGGICQGKCNPRKKLKFDEGEYHHKKRWIDAGPTSVDNGLLLCKECHDRIHTKNYKDTGE